MITKARAELYEKGKIVKTEEEYFEVAEYLEWMEKNLLAKYKNDTSPAAEKVFNYYQIFAEAILPYEIEHDLLPI